MHLIPSGVIHRLDLTQAFDTQSSWDLRVTAPPGEDQAVTVSFVRQSDASPSDGVAQRMRHCREPIKLFPGERGFYRLLECRLVYSKPEDRAPLVLIKACTLRYGNCSSWISTLLYAYDRESDSFHSVFFGLTASDTKQATRFIDSGPLLGRVVVLTPASGAHVGRVVEVYKRSVIGEYLRTLVYCRSTCCASDTDSDSAIDSEIPEILRRLGMDQMSALAS